MAAVDPNATESVIERASDQQVLALLESAWSVRDAAEVRRKTIRAALEKLAAVLCAFEINAQGLKIEEMDDNDLYKFIGHTTKSKIDEGLWYKAQFDAGRDARHHAVSVAQKEWEKKERELLTQLDVAKEKASSLERTVDMLRGDITRLAKQSKSNEDARRRAEETVEARQQQIDMLRTELVTTRQQMFMYPAGMRTAVAPAVLPPVGTTVLPALATARATSEPESAPPMRPPLPTVPIAPTTPVKSIIPAVEVDRSNLPTVEFVEFEVSAGEEGAGDTLFADIESWTSSGFYENDTLFLDLVAESLECRRTELFQLFGGRANSNTTKVAMTRRLVRLGLLKVVEAKGRPGNAPQMLLLGSDGLIDYKVRHSEPAVDAFSRYLLKHKSVEQIRLMLEVCDVFERAGYQVERFPQHQRLLNNRLFDPDLSVSRGDVSPFFVELETDAFKGRESRVAKWRNIAEGGNGYIYVVKYSAMKLDELRSEILEIQYKHLVTVGVTTLADLTAALNDNRPHFELFGRLRTVPARDVTY